MERELGELPGDVRSIIGSYIIPELGRSVLEEGPSLGDEKLVRQAAMYVADSSKLPSYDESIFISMLEPTIDTLETAANSGYYTATKYLLSLMKGTQPSSWYLLRAAVKSGNTDNLQEAIELSGDVKLEELLDMTSDADAAVFSWIYDRYRDFITPEHLTSVFDRAAISGNSPLNDLLLTGYASGLIPRFRIGPWGFVEFLLRTSPDKLRIALDLHPEITQYDLSKVMDQPDKIRVILEGGYRPERAFIIEAISGGHAGTIRVLEAFDPTIDIKDEGYWVDAKIGYQQARRLIDAGIVPPDETIVRVIIGNVLYDEPIGDDALTLIPYLSDKEALLRDVSLITLPDLRRLVRAGAVLSQSSLETAFDEGDTNKITFIMKRGFVPTYEDLYATLLKGRRKLFEKYKHLYPLGWYLTEEAGRTLDELDLIEIITESNILEPEELKDVLVGAIKTGKNHLVAHINELFPDYDLYGAFLRSWRGIDPDQREKRAGVKFLMDEGYRMGVETVPLVSGLLSDLDIATSLDEKSKKNIKKLARSGEGKVALAYSELLGLSPSEAKKFVRKPDRPADHKLDQAIRAGDLNEVKLAIAEGANVTARNNSPIKLAVSVGASVPILSELYEHGADLSAGDNLLLMDAIIREDRPMMTWILERIDMPPGALTFAADQGKMGSVMHLLEMDESSQEERDYALEVLMRAQD